MPRNTDGMPFELFPRPTKGEDGKPLLYPRPAAPYKRTMKSVEEYCAYRGVNRGLVKIAFDTFMEACSGWLAEGYRVETPLGTFSPKIRLEGDFTDPDKVRGKDVKFAGLEITPSKQFTRMVADKQQGFYKKETSVGNSQMYDAALMDKALRRSMQNGFITIRTFMLLAKLKYHSAQRYLNSLCKGPDATLRREKVGSTYHYFPLQP